MTARAQAVGCYLRHVLLGVVDVLLERPVARFATQLGMPVVLGRIEADAEGGVLRAPRCLRARADCMCPRDNPHRREVIGSALMSFNAPAR